MSELERLRELDADATRGPWKVLEYRKPWKIERSAPSQFPSEGEHIGRRIVTAWDHPQAKGPLPVTGYMIGIGTSDSGPAYFDHISQRDAEFIIACVAYVRAMLASTPPAVAG